MSDTDDFLETMRAMRRAWDRIRERADFSRQEMWRSYDPHPSFPDWYKGGGYVRQPNYYSFRLLALEGDTSVRGVFGKPDNDPEWYPIEPLPTERQTNIRRWKRDVIEQSVVKSISDRLPLPRYDP